MTSWVMPSHIHEGLQFHLSGSMKRYENSERGLLRAMKGPWHSWDGDLTKSADNVILNNHWPDPIAHDKFKDPQGEFKSPYHVGEHPASDTERLVAPRGYVIRPVQSRFEEAAGTGRPGFVFALEPKGPHWNEEDMLALWYMAHIWQRPTIIKCAYTHPLQVAKSVGFQTRYTDGHKPGM